MALGQFEVYAGDFKKCKNHYRYRNKLVMSKRWRLFRERIKLKNIESVEVASEEAVKRQGVIVGWGVAGARLHDLRHRDAFQMLAQ